MLHLHYSSRLPYPRRKPSHKRPRGLDGEEHACFLLQLISYANVMFPLKVCKKGMLPLTTISAELKGFSQITFFMWCWCALHLLSPGKMSVNQHCIDSAYIQFAGTSKSQGLR